MLALLLCSLSDTVSLFVLLQSMCVFNLILVLAHHQEQVPVWAGIVDDEHLIKGARTIDVKQK